MALSFDLAFAFDLCPLTFALDFSLETREKSILHHLRDVADETLSETSDGSAGFDRSRYVHDRRGAIRTKRDGGVAFDEAGLALAIDDQPILRVRHLVGDLHVAFVASGDGGKRHRERGAIPI